MSFDQQLLFSDSEEPVPVGMCSACRTLVGLQNLAPVPPDHLCMGEVPPVLLCRHCLWKRPFQIEDHKVQILERLRQQQRISQWGDQIVIDNPTAEQLRIWENDKPGCTYILSTQTQHVYKIGMTNANVGQRESSFRSKAPGAKFVHALYSQIPGTLETELHKHFKFAHDCNPRSTEIVVLSPQALAWLRSVKSIKINIRNLVDDDRKYTYEVKHVLSRVQCNTLIKGTVSTERG